MTENLYCTVKIISLLLGFEVLEHGAGIGHFERIGARVLRNATTLDEKLLQLHVIDDGTVAPRALAEPTLRVPGATHTHATREEGSSVGDQLDLAESVGSDGLVLRKSAVIECNRIKILDDVMSKQRKQELLY